MKTLTCKELGGPCDQAISAQSWDEMVKKMTQHVTENHPDTAKEMEKMHAEDPVMEIRKRFEPINTQEKQALFEQTCSESTTLLPDLDSNQDTLLQRQ